jgi:hypothetical protein
MKLASERTEVIKQKFLTYEIGKVRETVDRDQHKSQMNSVSAYEVIQYVQIISIYLFNWTIKGGIEICRTHMMLECELSPTVFG